ncbi:MAG: FtsQ-type POTRA domain-containing protein [Chloroflexi bacterium]|nr:FtsQ-type POTRA domain-containing protein [Chloroflexota bacterium]
MRNQEQESRREAGSRGHVRPLDTAETEEQARPALQRMKPRSQQVRHMAATSATQRRVERRVRQARVQARRAAPVVKRRRINAWSLISWRAVSGLLVIGLTAILYLFLTTEAFFVSSVAIGGEKYLSREEIFRDSSIAQQHIFWVDPADVKQRLEAVPNIAQASVLVGWPPNMVQIMVVEREPALTWEQGVRVWVDVNGIVMKQREDRPDLLRIMYQNPPDPISVGQRIPQTMVDGALQLRRRNPALDVLLYDPMKGLGYRDNTRGWTVWFGTGEDLETKLLVYNALVNEILGDVQPGEIILTDPDRPYYTILWRND